MKIQNKLFLILFTYSLLLIGSLVLLMQLSIDKGMVEYVNTKEVEILQPVIIELIEEYKLQNDWGSIAGQHDKFRRLISKNHRSYQLESAPEHIRPPSKKAFYTPAPLNEYSTQHQKKPPRFNRPPPPPKIDDVHYALIGLHGEVIVGKAPSTFEFSKAAIYVEDKIVGYFAVSKRSKLTQGYEVDFVNQQHSYLLLIGLFSLVFVVLVTLPLTQHLVKPIKLITQGMHKLTQGNYQQSIKLTRGDELGQLSRDYNKLARTLAADDADRKRWLANISHELRTPMGILRAELEAMIDEVRPLSKRNISSANDEVKHLQRLIDDLYQLTSTDIGEMRYLKKNLTLNNLLKGELNKYRTYLSDSGITLHSNIIEQELSTCGDKTRLCQLFENIISNTAKYSNATQLTISLTIEATANRTDAVIAFEDNGIGVDDKHLDHLFEYLYRVEESRNRKYGGAGLGLSICRQIVNAHQGEIFAENAVSGGLIIVIKLPIS